MNWPVTQLMLCGAASLSIQAANDEKSIVEDVHEANKTLRFLKANAAVGLTYGRLGDLPEVLLGTYFDGCWVGYAPRWRRPAICGDSQCSRIWSTCAIGCDRLGIKEGESHFSSVTGRRSPSRCCLPLMLWSFPNCFMWECLCRLCPCKTTVFCERLE